MSEKAIEEIVEEAKKPGKFNIVDVLKERAYPTDSVNIYVDEDTAYKAAELSEELKRTSELDEKYAGISESLDTLMDTLSESKYVVTITGISEGKRDELYELAVKKYPIEFKENKNVLTGESTREEIESQERDELFTNLLWSAYITKIVAPNGAEQDGITPEDAEEMRKSLPIAANSIINAAIQNMRAATAVFMYKVDEDFLAKS